MSKVTKAKTPSPAVRGADQHDLIRVHGARVNNLKDAIGARVQDPPFAFLAIAT